MAPEPLELEPALPEPAQPELELLPALPEPEPEPAPPEPEPEPAPPEPAPPPAPRVSAPQPPPAPVRAPARSELAAPQLLHPEPPRPRRKIPIVAIVGGVALLAVVAVAVVVSLGKREGATSPAADSARAAVPAVPIAPAARTDSLAPSAQPAEEIGYVRIRGDLPDDAIIWLDGRRMPGRIFQASPGGHGLEIETGEFEPWETRITVRVRDTLRVDVELLLKTPTDSLR